MELIKSVDSYCESPKPVSPPRIRKGYYPSAANCILTNEYGEDETVGKCLRDSYWSHKSVEKSNPMNARGVRICAVGSMCERWEVEKYKEMGIWKGNNVKFFDTDHGISGEVDAFVWDEYKKCLVGVEIKTGYGYQFQSRVIGKPGRKGKPKPEHLMQVMLYMKYFKEIPLFKMVYIDRGNAARAEFNITIDKNSGAGVVDGNVYSDRLTIPALLNRYQELGKCLEDGVLPERDYQLQYSDDHIDFLNDSGRLSKANTKIWEKKKELELGDWRCSYCDYKDYCWKKEETK